MATMTILDDETWNIHRSVGLLAGRRPVCRNRSIYDIDDVYRMAQQAKDAAEEAKATAEEVTNAIGSLYAYGSMAWQLREAANCD